MTILWLGLALQVKLAKKLVEKSFADKVFFCNSGTEANEAVIKFARKYARVQGETEGVPSAFLQLAGCCCGGVCAVWQGTDVAATTSKLETGASLLGLKVCTFPVRDLNP